MTFGPPKADDNVNNQTSWYEDRIALRGCNVSLQRLAEVCREFDRLNQREADHVLNGLVKNPDQTQEDFDEYKRTVKPKAFRVTVSIVGFNGATSYGDGADIFQSKELPHPIRTVFFTNETAFKSQANGNLPPNRFAVAFHFDKPPLFDPNPLVSEETPNQSNVEIHASDIAYFRAAQKIGNNLKNNSRLWYSFLHAKFIYDAGLWFFWVPYSLYVIVSFLDRFLQSSTTSNAVRLASGVYTFALSLILYKIIFGYIKWAFPVNVLESNKDNANYHRVVLAGIFSGIFYSLPKQWILRMLGF